MSTKLKQCLFRCGFPFTCIILSSIHMLELTEIYLRFETSSDVMMGMPEFMFPTAFHVCFSYIDILDYDRIKRDNSSRDWRQPRSREELEKYKDELMIDEIFIYTPDTSEFMARAEYRKSNSYEWYECVGAACLSIFKVDKLLHTEFMCYSIESVIPSMNLASFNEIIETPSSGGGILKIFPSGAFARSSLLKMLTAQRGQLPYDSFLYSPALRRWFNNTKGELKYNSFVVSSSQSVTTRLEPPYKDPCEKYPSTRRETRQLCVAKKCPVTWEKYRSHYL